MIKKINTLSKRLGVPYNIEKIKKDFGGFSDLMCHQFVLEIISDPYISFEEKTRILN